MCEIGVLCFPPLQQFFFFGVMSDPHIALTRALSQSGLTYKKQRELHLQMAQDLERGPADRFPDAPRNYIARARDLLFPVSLPQFGPLNISQSQGRREVVPWRKAWDLLLQELFHNSFRPNWKRPVSEIHDAMIEVITSQAKNDFPLPAPPRWAAEPFFFLAILPN